MRKDTKNLLILGALGVAAFFLLAKKADAQTVGTPDTSTGPSAPFVDPVAPTVTPGVLVTRYKDEQGKTQELSRSFSTPAQGVALINEAVAAGQTLRSTSTTIAKIPSTSTVSVKLPSGKTETYKGGTITTLGGGKTVYIGVKSKNPTKNTTLRK